MEGPESNIKIVYIENTNGRGYYTTLDSYIAGYLFDLGHKHELVCEDETGKYSFRFPLSDGLLQALHEYRSGNAVVNALQYSRTIKALRGEILKKRDGQNGNSRFTRTR